MSSEEVDLIVQQVATLRQDERFLNYTAQANARAILQRLGTPSDQWPAFSPFELDLHYTAHYLFWQGLQLRRFPEYRPQGDELIKLGCESLESLYAWQPIDHPDRVTQLFNAALGYYIAGYYARSFVLMRDLRSQSPLPQEFELVRRLLLKDLRGVRELVTTVLADDGFSDGMIAAAMATDNLSRDEATDRILRATLNRAVSFFLEYPKTGYRELLERAIELAENGVTLALYTGFVDWWWLLYCTGRLFSEHGDSSMWSSLSPMGGDDPDRRFVEPYIRANYSRQTPIIELWPSQRIALPNINDSQRRSYCLKMPTSAGKTRIAELAILRFLLDHTSDPTSKCVYVAPYRSLAAEVEDNLRHSFHPLGVRVSELYGGLELDLADQLVFEEARILVATPEKVDALLRYDPSFIERLGLVIFDEGHIIGLSDRGIRYEFFLHRMVKRLKGSKARLFFISAVLPNIDEFAEWLTGDSEALITSEWRPSRLVVGELSWNGHVARIDYSERDHHPLGHQCFVPYFIRQVDPRGLPGIRYRRLFPHDITEVVAEAGVSFAQQGMTMIFCARKASVSTVAEATIRSALIHQALAKARGETWSLPVGPGAQPAIAECISVANEYMGSDNDLSRYLRAGFAVHHTDIPRSVRLKLERLIRSGAIQLVIATSTLAQGVNLPIQTVIVHGLSHGHDEAVSPLTFWNICGRAGRGMEENEGQVLFAVDLDLPGIRLRHEAGLKPAEVTRGREYKKQMRIQNELVSRTNLINEFSTYRLISSLQQLFNQILNSWHEVYDSQDMAEICARLAENDLSWLPAEQQPDVSRWLDVLDAELLALIQEGGNESVTPDILQKAMAGSLLYLQAGKVENAQSRIDALTELLYARWKHTEAMAPTSDHRQRFYRLGFRLSDCAAIEAKSQSLLALLTEADAFEQWGASERCDYLIRLAEFVFTNVAELKPPQIEMMACWNRILALWLSGSSPNEIAVDQTVGQYTHSPAKISSFVEDAIVYRLAWGANALAQYGEQLVLGSASHVPPVMQFLPALLKYGVHDPAASFLLAMGLGSRKVALKVMAQYSQSRTDGSQVLTWFLALEQTALLAAGLDEDEVRIIVEAQSRIRPSGQNSSSYAVPTRLEVAIDRTSLPEGLAGGDVLSLQHRPDISSRAFSLSTLWGVQLGVFEHSEPLPMAWTKPERISTRLLGIEQVSKGQVRLEIKIDILQAA